MFLARRASAPKSRTFCALMLPLTASISVSNTVMKKPMDVQAPTKPFGVPFSLRLHRALVLCPMAVAWGCRTR